jgi:hypothetical protein
MTGRKKDTMTAVVKKKPLNTLAGKYSVHLTLFLLFIISVLYFSVFAKHVFSYQDNQTLFVYSGEYLYQFLQKPGGFLEYAGNFLSQVYFSPLFGSLLLASIFTLTAFVFLKIGKKIYSEGPLLLTLMVLPSCMMILLQSDFNYQLHNNLGFLVASAWFLFLINPGKSTNHFFRVALFPVLYLLTGGFAWIFAGMYIIYSLLRKNFLYPLLIIIVAVLTVYLYKELLFLQPLNQMVYYPLPQLVFFRHHALLFLIYTLFILWPGILKLLSGIRVHTYDRGSLSLYLVAILFSMTIFILSRLYNPETGNLFRLEKLVQNEKWEEVIRLQEKIQSHNVVAQYYYNLALSGTDQLCDRMFFGRQDFGPGSLMVQWDSRANINQIFRGAYFFYNIGLINEAHRWAFESMVMQGYRPENIKMLIKTELINGHYKVAAKYISVLKRTLRYRNIANKYEVMLDHPELVKNDLEMGRKVSLRSGEDFLIRLKDQQANVMLLLQSNPGNTRAFEYMIAWFMLEGNIGKVAEEFKKIPVLGYKRIPRHIEEAAMYFVANSGKVPDMGNLEISQATVSRFASFENSVSNRSNMVPGDADKLRKSFGNTLWYYLEFR